jgi:hypothetical protein
VPLFANMTFLDLCLAEFAIGAALGVIWRWRPILLLYAALFAGLTLALASGDWSNLWRGLDLNGFMLLSLTAFSYFGGTVPLAFCGAIGTYSLRRIACRNRKPPKNMEPIF